MTCPRLSKSTRCATTLGWIPFRRVQSPARWNSRKRDLDSDLRFGRADMLAPAVEAMAYRKDIGAELADGSLRLATKYGHPELSMTSKGMEMPTYDPRGLQGQGLLYATSNRGGCHMRGNMIGLEVLGLPKLIDRFQVQGKSSFVRSTIRCSLCCDCMGVEIPH